MRAAEVWLLLLALSSVAVVLAFDDAKEYADLEDTVTQPENSEVDAIASKATPEKLLRRKHHHHDKQKDSEEDYPPPHQHDYPNPSSPPRPHYYPTPPRHPSPSPSPSSPSPSPSSPSPSPSSPSPSPPSPSPTPPSPSPPPTEEYCCGTTCRTPVPRPPQGVPPGAEGLRPPPWPVTPKTRRITFNNRIKAPKGPHALAQCRAQGLRSPVAGPPFTGVQMATVNIQIAATSRTNPACNGVFTCTGNLIAPNMVLTAAHCVVDTPSQNCPDLAMSAARVCSNFNPGSPNPNWDCPADGQNGVTTRDAIGISWNQAFVKTGSNQANDVAIIFLADPIELDEYFQYNYIENFDALNTGSVSGSWMSLAYTGAGVPANSPVGARCGCNVCNRISCNLSQTGPLDATVDYRTLGLQLEPGFESCAGSSGSCVTLNGAACCVGTLSYGPDDPVDTCNVNRCSEGRYTALTSTFPLTQLWDQIDRVFT